MAMGKTRVVIDRNLAAGTVSDTLYGIFIEDINFACDGGLNANVLRNYSFDDIYLKNKHANMLRFITHTAGRMKRNADRLRYWRCTGGELESSNESPVVPNAWYASFTADGEGRLKNYGYNGDVHENPAIAIAKDETYQLSLYIRSKNFSGSVEVFVEDMQGHVLTSAVVIPVSAEWTKQTVTVQGARTAYGIFVLHFKGAGTVDLDCLDFHNTNTWGAQDAKWSQGKLRRDLVEALVELKPRFVRFPGGCLVEGIEDGNEYQWKRGVGSIISREPDYNLWATESKDNGYGQSMQIGFYEYFLLCEDLGAEPLPVVWAGLNCQQRRRGKVDIDAPDFYERVVQNALDLIEYANGDPAANKWAALRAEAGHPEPFGLKYIGIGNENVGEDYLKRFTVIKKAIDERYSGITCILSAGGLSQGKDFDAAWEFANKNCPDVYIDEHMYKKPASIIEASTRYDSYDRNGAKVFMGEYAAFDILNMKLIPNQFDTALAEAAFYTGMERNSDVVKMFCYAPLFCLINGRHWKHNLIYFNPAHLVKSANFMVHRMFSANIGEEILKIGGSLPESVFMSATAGADALFVKMVNVGENEEMILISLEGFTASQAEVTEVTAAATARNTIEFIGEPTYEVKPKTMNKSAEDAKMVMLAAQSVVVIKFVK